MSTVVPPTRRPPANRQLGYATGFVSFVAKGVCALLITYVVANRLDAPDFALWSTVFSLATILSVADLGIGQLILTTFHEHRNTPFDERRLVSNAVAAMTALALIIFVLTAAIFAWQDVFERVRWKYLLIATILLRIPLIPSAGYIMALERYHERKILEAVTYALALLFVVWAAYTDLSLSLLLLGMNALLTLGGIALQMRARYLGMPRFDARAVQPAAMRSVVRESFPYFVANTSGLATYGGFIALSALVLSELELARLSLLHNLLLMQVLQVFEWVFRSAQPRIHTAGVMARLRLLIGASYGAALFVAATFGAWLIAILFKKYEYTAVELAVYTTFVFLEVYYNLVVSAMQMRSAVKKRLQWMSLLKAAAFLLVLGLTRAISNQPSILGYSLVLVGYSAVLAMLTARAGGSSERVALQSARA